MPAQDEALTIFPWERDALESVKRRFGIEDEAEAVRALNSGQKVRRDGRPRRKAQPARVARLARRLSGLPEWSRPTFDFSARFSAGRSPFMGNPR